MTSLRARGLEMMREKLDGPEPPVRATFRSSYPVGLRWRARGYVAAVEQLMAGRPYDLVEKGVGTERDLIEQGLVKRPKHGPQHDPRARVVHLRYVRRGAPLAGVPARVPA